VAHNPNSQGESNGRTALQIALIIRRDTRTYNEEGVKELLDSGVSVDVLDEAGKRMVEVWRWKRREGFKSDGSALLVLAWNVDPSGPLTTSPTLNFEVFEVTAGQGNRI
jgi:hypothetical protein